MVETGADAGAGGLITGSGRAGAGLPPGRTDGAGGCGALPCATGVGFSAPGVVAGVITRPEGVVAGGFSVGVSEGSGGG